MIRFSATMLAAFLVVAVNTAAIADSASEQILSPCEEANNDDATLDACTRAIQSGQLDDTDITVAYINRGAAWADKGDYDKAIADYTKAIRANPQPDADALLDRGTIWLVKSPPNVGKAIRDFSAAIQGQQNQNNELDTKDYLTAFLYSGAAQFELGRYDLAIDDFAKIDSENPYRNINSTPDPRAAIWSYLAAARAGRPSTDALSATMAGLSGLDWVQSTWPMEMAGSRYFMGSLTEAALLDAATNPDATKQSGYLCKAHFYIGEAALIHGDKKKAATQFHEALSTGCPDGIAEFSVARAELAKLHGPRRKR